MRGRRRNQPTTNERQIAAIVRFSAAVARGDRDELAAATGDLLEVFAATAQRLVTQALAFVLDQQAADRQRLTRLEEHAILHQRHLQLIDRILDEQARAREIEG